MSLLRPTAAEGPVRLWRRVTRERPDLVLVPLQGGAGAFVGGGRLISLLEPPGPNSTWPRRLLERIQARRSVLLVAPERPVAVACALRWRLDLARIRLLPDLGCGVEEGLGVELSLAQAQEWAWHSTW